MALRGVRISVTHIGEEGRLRKVGIFCFLLGKCQLLFCLFELGDIVHGEYHILFFVKEKIGTGYYGVTFYGFLFGSKHIQSCIKVCEASSLFESLTDGATYGTGTAVSMSTATSFCR